jgi:Mg-chelatase subunit ChlD
MRERLVEAGLALVVVALEVDLVLRTFAADSDARWLALAALVLTLALCAALARARRFAGAPGGGLCLLTCAVLGAALRGGPDTPGPLGLSAPGAVAPLVLAHAGLLATSGRDALRAAFARLPGALAAVLPLPVAYALGGTLLRAVVGPRPDGVLGGLGALPLAVQPGTVMLLGILPVGVATLLVVDAVSAWRTRSLRPLERDAGLAASALVCVGFGLIVGAARGELGFERGSVDRLGVHGWWTCDEELFVEDGFVSVAPPPRPVVTTTPPVSPWLAPTPAPAPPTAPEPTAPEPTPAPAPAPEPAPAAEPTVASVEPAAPTDPLVGRTIDLALRSNGGAIVLHTSQHSPYQSVASLNDGLPGGWTSADGALPQDLVVGFARGAAATLAAIELVPDPDAPVSDRPGVVEVAVSDVSPLDGFRVVIAAATLGPEGGRLAIDPPARARYVRVRVSATCGRASFVRLGELRVIEAPHGVDGYRSLLAGGGEEDRPSVAAPEQGCVSPADGHELEGEGSTPLPLAVTLEGRIVPRGEVDRFTLDVPAGPGGAPRVVSLTLEGRPLRSSLTVRDDAGQVVASLDPGRVSGDREVVSFVARGARYTIDVTEPRATLALLFDVSVSMERDMGELERVLRAFVARTQPSEDVALLPFSRAAVLRAEPTSDPQRLARDLDGAFELGGSTSLHDALITANELLATRPGNRAIVLFTDGADTSSGCTYPGLWEYLRTRRVPTYAIGLGGGLDEVNRAQGCSSVAALRAIADATGARAWHTPDASGLEAAYDQVAAELRRASSYRLRAELVTGVGRLVVDDPHRALAKADAPERVALLLDVSGSMAEPLPGARSRKQKLAVAREVLSSFLARLPDASQVALRVFGGRANEPTTTLLAPLAPVDRPRLAALLRRVRPSGRTPMAAALREVPADLGDAGGERAVVLISDGRETCGGDPVAEAYRLVEAGLRVRVHVVGFCVNDAEASALRAIARASGGRFVRANDAAALDAALTEAVQSTFRVEDAAGEVLLRGPVDGAARALPAGTFRLVIEGAAPMVLDVVEVKDQATTRVVVERDGERLVARVAAE